MKRVLFRVDLKVSVTLQTSEVFTFTAPLLNTHHSHSSSDVSRNRPGTAGRRANEKERGEGRVGQAGGGQEPAAAVIARHQSEFEGGII